MQPTLNPDWCQRSDYVLFKRIPRENLDLGRLENKVVVLRNPGNVQDLQIKRVAGLPGDKVCRNAPFAKDPELIQVPADHVWVTSDKGLGFKDSNYYGAVERRAVLAVVKFIVWPLDRVGRVQ